MTTTDDTTSELSLRCSLVKALCYLRGSCSRRNDVSKRSVYAGTAILLLYSNISNIFCLL